MLTPRKKTTLLAALPQSYENNYRHLLQLIPNLKDIQENKQLRLNNIEQLIITIQEQHRYTTIINIEHQFQDALLPDLTMIIRIYYDARMAEVIGFQGCTHIQPNYPYPNPSMHQPLEKCQINHLFDDWLKHCKEIIYLHKMQTFT